jgi:hypothetical protein
MTPGRHLPWKNLISSSRFCDGAALGAARDGQVSKIEAKGAFTRL